MTNEEMRRAMEFMVEMEARSSAKIDAITEVPEGSRRKMGARE